MKLKLNSPCDTQEKREHFANFLSATIEGQFDTSFRPYLGSSPYDWKLDTANDWFLHFNPTKPDEVAIHYRYENEENCREKALTLWLKFRIGAIVV